VIVWNLANTARANAASAICGKNTVLAVRTCRGMKAAAIHVGLIAIFHAIGDEAILANANTAEA